MKSDKRISIRVQVFLALFAIIFVMALIFSPYGFYTNVTSIRNSVDERLKVAVHGVREIIPEDYHDRLAEGRVSEREYDALRQKLCEFQKRIGVTYLYALALRDDGVICYTLDQELGPMSVYENPSADTLETFQKRTPVFEQCADSDYGLVSRTALLPFYTPKGHFYVIGADLNITEIRPMVLAALRHFALLVALGVALGIVVTIYLTRRISLPIQKLSQFTQSLAAHNFSRALRMEDEVPPRLIKAKEVSLLAHSVESMRDKLDVYIEDLKREMTARDRAEQELKIAGGIQMSFLPGGAFVSGNLEVAALMKTAKQAGGDLYDFFNLSDGRACVAIGDVSGKGMPAALFMARAITLIRAAAFLTSDLGRMVPFINDLLSRGNETATFVTFFIGAYDTKTGVLSYVNCGHNPPYLMHADGRVEAVAVKPNSILGVFEGQTFVEETRALAAGDTLVCYTDGVTEAQNADGGFYGEARFAARLGALKGASVRDVADAVMADVGAFAAGCEQSDDITLLVLRRNAAASDVGRAVSGA